MDDTRIPPRSYELIRLLDKATPRPNWPIDMSSARKFDEGALREALIAVGARQLVDSLIAEMLSEIDSADQAHADITIEGSINDEDTGDATEYRVLRSSDEHGEIYPSTGLNRVERGPIGSLLDMGDSEG